jgi:hypothetical protein
MTIGCGYRLSLGPHVRWSIRHLTGIRWIGESGGELTRLRSSGFRPGLIPNPLVLYDTDRDTLLHHAC